MSACMLSFCISPELVQNQYFYLSVSLSILIHLYLFIIIVSDGNNNSYLLSLYILSQKFLPVCLYVCLSLSLFHTF